MLWKTESALYFPESLNKSLKICLNTNGLKCLDKVRAKNRSYVFSSVIELFTYSKLVFSTYGGPGFKLLNNYHNSRKFIFSCCYDSGTKITSYIQNEMLTETILVVVWSRLKITKHVSQFLVTFIELFRDSSFPNRKNNAKSAAISGFFKLAVEALFGI